MIIIQRRAVCIKNNLGIFGDIALSHLVRGLCAHVSKLINIPACIQPYIHTCIHTYIHTYIKIDIHIGSIIYSHLLV